MHSITGFGIECLLLLSSDVTKCTCFQQRQIMYCVFEFSVHHKRSILIRGPGEPSLMIECTSLTGG